MFKIERHEDSPWRDPRVEFLCGQLQTLIDALEVCANQDAADPELYDDADHLCEGSRSLLFKVHRVTREQLVLIRTVFQKASDIIERIALADPDRQILVLDYAKHIRKRVEMVDQALRDPVAAVAPIADVSVSVCDQ